MVRAILDTCVVSELVKPQIGPHVVRSLNAYDSTELYPSVLTVGEITRASACSEMAGADEELNSGSLVWRQPAGSGFFRLIWRLPGCGEH